ncbi:hypothetical protein ACJX0J_009959, partial [Zea mays]
MICLKEKAYIKITGHAYNHKPAELFPTKLPGRDFQFSLFLRPHFYFIRLPLAKEDYEGGLPQGDATGDLRTFGGRRGLGTPNHGYNTKVFVGEDITFLEEQYEGDEWDFAFVGFVGQIAW